MSNAFEKFIKEKCNEKGYSLRKIGVELSNLDAMSVNHFYKILKDPSMLSATELLQIAQILHLKPRQVLRLINTLDKRSK